MGNVRKLTPPILRGDGEGCESKKSNLQGKARVTRAREKLVLIFFHPTSKKDRKVKIAL